MDGDAMVAVRFAVDLFIVLRKLIKLLLPILIHQMLHKAGNLHKRELSRLILTHLFIAINLVQELAWSKEIILDE